jgi:ADP-heptose:LPS heptosyltransferase
MSGDQEVRMSTPESDGDAYARLACCELEPRLRLDCRHYRGERPCALGIQGVCPSACRFYAPPGHRILIIKLAALGDVIRTGALLPGLKHAWPNSHITWVTRPNGVCMLANHPLIDRLLPFDAETICHLEHERFDLCLSLDKQPGPAALAMRVDAPDKRGIGLSTYGTVFPLNSACVAYFRLGLDDELKFHHNDKSYQQLIYEAVGLSYRGQEYRLYPGPENRGRAGRLWQTLGIEPNETVVGLNTGAGGVFANKTWPVEKFIALASRLVKHKAWRVVLLGGPPEVELNRCIAAACPGARNPGCDHSELDFAALVERCAVVVTGDTLALHVAIACQVPVVGLFGPTCAQEIDLFGRGTKIPTRLACSPCYRHSCDRSPNCMDEITLEQVLAAVERWVREPLPQTVALPALADSAVEACR